MTAPDILRIDPDQRDLIADRIGTSLRKGVYVLAVAGFEISGGERVTGFDDLSSVLFTITRSYPNHEILTSFFDDDQFIIRGITADDFEELHHSAKLTDAEMKEFFKAISTEPTSPPEPPLKN